MTKLVAWVLLLPLCGGCVTAVTQDVLGEARGDLVFGRPTRAWRRDGRLLVERAAGDVPMHCVPLALPFMTFDGACGPCVVEYEEDGAVAHVLPARDDDARWPPASVAPVSLDALPPLADRYEEAHPIALLLQALTLPVTLAVDVLDPLILLGCVVADELD